jgi:hypothetical protein
MAQFDNPYGQLARRALQRHVRCSRAWVAQACPQPVAWLLDAEIERLPEQPKAAVVTCYLEERSLPEAAAILGWSRRKVRTQLLLGRRRLLRRLKRQGLLLSARSLRRILREGAGWEEMSARTQTVLLATSGAAAVAWSSRLAELVRGALQAVDQWMA